MKSRTMIAFVLVLVMILAACTPGETPTPSMPSATPQVNTVVRSSRLLIAKSFSERVAHADVIVIGKVIAREEVVNSARDPGDISRPDPNLFGIAQVYLLEVERVLKGKVPAQIRFIQYEGSLLIEDNVQPSAAEIQAEIQKNAFQTYTPLSFEKRYLFLLALPSTGHYELDGNDNSTLYRGVYEPWRFEITQDKLVILEPHNNSLQPYFPPQTIDQVLAAISLEVAPFETVAPFEVITPTLTLQPLAGTPYP